MTRAAASEWGGDNIRVLPIAPHAESPGMKWWIENISDETAEFFKTIPLGRVGNCEEDIGRAVVGLCSPRKHTVSSQQHCPALLGCNAMREVLQSERLHEGAVVLSGRVVASDHEQCPHISCTCPTPDRHPAAALPVGRSVAENGSRSHDLDEC